MKQWAACSLLSLFTLGNVTLLGQEQPSNKKSANPADRPPLVDPDVGVIYHSKLFGGPFGIPRLVDVVQIEVELTAGKLDENSSFVVPKEFHEKILAPFEPVIIQSKPLLGMHEILSLKIWTKDERVRRICVYGGAQVPMNFSLHGVRCVVDRPTKDFTDEGYVFLDFTAGIRAKSTKRDTGVER